MSSERQVEAGKRGRLGLGRGPRFTKGEKSAFFSFDMMRRLRAKMLSDGRER